MGACLPAKRVGGFCQERVMRCAASGVAEENVVYSHSSDEFSFDGDVPN